MVLLYIIADSEKIFYKEEPLNFDGGIIIFCSVLYLKGRAAGMLMPVTQFTSCDLYAHNSSFFISQQQSRFKTGMCGTT